MATPRKSKAGRLTSLILSFIPNSAGLRRKDETGRTVIPFFGARSDAIMTGFELAPRRCDSQR